jgi:hypothetical protein
MKEKKNNLDNYYRWTCFGGASEIKPKQKINSIV